MDIDPRDYNPDELRGSPLAPDPHRSSGEGTERDGDRGSSAGSSRPPPATGPPGIGDRAGENDAGRYRQLATLERSINGDPQKPYLTEFPTAFSQEGLVFEWLESLLCITGRGGTIEALRYYREIGWLTEEAESELREYVRGLDGDEIGAEEKLGMDKHIESLVYITRWRRWPAERGKREASTEPTRPERTSTVD